MPSEPKAAGEISLSGRTTMTPLDVQATHAYIRDTNTFGPCHTTINNHKNSVKDEYSPSPYLVLTRKNPSRKALVRFRISSHQLRIETGRYEKIPRDERICYFCTGNKIKDENHFLLDCKAYSQIRDKFFSKLGTKIPDFKSLSHDTLISLLMNSSDYLINCQLVSFISQCFELRTKLISMNE